VCSSDLYAPAGVYMVADVYLGGSVLLHGAGMEKTTLKASKNCTKGVLYAAQPFTRVKNLSISGNKASGFTANGFFTDSLMYGAANFCQVIDSVQISDCSAHGIYVKGGNAFSLLNSRLYGCDGALVYLDNANKYLIDNCDLELSASRGIDIVNVTPRGGFAAGGGTISNNWFEGLSTDYCLSVIGYNHYIYNNKFQASLTTTASIIILATSDNCII